MAIYTISPALIGPIIQSELQKRRSAYPKLIKKAENKGDSQAKIDALKITLALQHQILQGAYDLIFGYKTEIKPADAMAELNRELAMRKKVYAHWVAKKWMKQEAADRQLAEWQAVIDHFNYHFGNEKD